MNEQVASFIPHLKQGSTYLFEHARKGPFVGVFKGTRPTKAGDPQDTLWIEVDAYTEDGSGQERLANAFIRDDQGRKMRPVYSGKLIRPSLLRSISSPSSDTAKEMGERFAKVRAEAEQRARENGTNDLDLPTISVPTNKAMKTLSAGTSKPSLLKKLWYWPGKVN